MKKILMFVVVTSLLLADCSHFQKVVKIDFSSVSTGELPSGWIVSSSGKSFPAIWEVNEKKQLYIRYPRGSQESEKNIFFTKDYYFRDGAMGAKLWSKEDAGIIFRARDRKNYYAVLLDFAKKRLLVEEVENKKPKKLLVEKIALTTKPQELRVLFCDGEAKIFLNQKEVAKLSHLKKRAGGVGVIASGSSQAFFDNLVIEVAR